jgi:hypothetical protein
MSKANYSTMLAIREYSSTEYLGGLFTITRGSKYTLDEKYEECNTGTLLNRKYFSEKSSIHRPQILLAGRIDEASVISQGINAKDIYNQNAKFAC